MIYDSSHSADAFTQKQKHIHTEAPSVACRKRVLLLLERVENWNDADAILARGKAERAKANVINERAISKKEHNQMWAFPCTLLVSARRNTTP